MGPLDESAIAYLLRVRLGWLDFTLDPSVAGDPKWWTAFAAVGGLLLAAGSAYWAGRQWRTQYLISQWHETVAFLQLHPEHMDPEVNDAYVTNFTGEEGRSYELTARRSIAYVDDLFALRMHRHLRSWLSGSMDLFVAPHLAWFYDHQSAYSPKFRAAVAKALPRDEPPHRHLT